MPKRILLGNYFDSQVSLDSKQKINVQRREEGMMKGTIR
jgi:hypothetical protein